jgi:hypothetical protein
LNSTFLIWLFFKTALHWCIACNPNQQFGFNFSFQLIFNSGNKFLNSLHFREN